MIQGFAAWAAIAVASIGGRSAFAAWRRQKITERKMDAAEQALAAAYVAQRTIDRARHRYQSEDEVQAAAGRLGKQGVNPNSMAAERWGRLITSEVIRARLAEENSGWRRLGDIMPVAHALIGGDVQNYLRALFHIRDRIVSASAEHVDADGDLIALVPYRMVMQTGWAEPDLFGDDIERIIVGIEERLLPIIREER